MDEVVGAGLMRGLEKIEEVEVEVARVSNRFFFSFVSFFLASDSLARSFKRKSESTRDI